ncbi:hypothetical protein BYT27DRAFT_7263717 [Phlegmacium glaucopus]|nr:hypothetical protein BYT27DRAFT_7263717 [Phlegmacium glaucopus]
MAHMTPTKIREALVGFDDQVRLGVEEGNIHATMRHIGRRLEERLAPNFMAQQQAALLEFAWFAPVSQPGIRSPMRPGAPAPVAIHTRAAAPTRTVTSKPKAANVTPASRQPQQSHPAAGAPATCVPTDPRTAPTAHVPTDARMAPVP